MVNPGPERRDRALPRLGVASLNLNVELISVHDLWSVLPYAGIVIYNFCLKKQWLIVDYRTIGESQPHRPVSECTYAHS